MVILGAGLAGLSTAWHLRDRPYLLVEREARVGGKATSNRQDGFTFDITGHWLHLRDARVKALVQGLFAPGELVSVARKTNVFSHGALLHYPFQANLHGLPLEVVQECLEGFMEAQAEARTGRPEPRTFAEFAQARFGRGIARHFFVPYNTKLWGMSPDHITADWVSRFVPLPDARQIIGGAIGIAQQGLGYNVEFIYPAKGGIDALPEAMRGALTVQGGGELLLGSDVDEVDPAGRRVKLGARPDWTDYEALVSTMPLPELIKRIPSAPDEVREAAGNLRWASWRYLDVATRRPTKADYQWVYVPEERFPFFRVGVYTNAVETMAPPDRGSLYVELTDRDAEPDVADVGRALTELGTLHDPQDILFATRRDVDYAYVVFDDAYVPSRGLILDWLESQGIRSCGRYGSWIYNSMEDSILQGMDAATWAEEQTP